jgi:hypothetical protein
MKIMRSAGCVAVAMVFSSVPSIAQAQGALWSNIFGLGGNSCHHSGWVDPSSGTLSASCSLGPGMMGQVAGRADGAGPGEFFALAEATFIREANALPALISNSESYWRGGMTWSGGVPIHRAALMLDYAFAVALDVSGSAGGVADGGAGIQGAAPGSLFILDIWDEISFGTSSSQDSGLFEWSINLSGAPSGTEPFWLSIGSYSRLVYSDAGIFSASASSSAQASLASARFYSYDQHSNEIDVTDQVSYFFHPAPATTVPEPMSLFLIGTGLVAVAGFRRRYKV